MKNTSNSNNQNPVSNNPEEILEDEIIELLMDVGIEVDKKRAIAFFSPKAIKMARFSGKTIQECQAILEEGQALEAELSAISEDELTAILNAKQSA